MHLSAKRRWALYGIALALSLAAIDWADGRDAPNETNTLQQTKSTAVSARYSAESKQPMLSLQAPNRAPAIAPTADPFSARAWQQSEQMETRNAAPAKPLAAQPPPLDFIYMGKMIEGTQTLVFLSRQDRNYVARLGATLDGLYRVKQISDTHLTLDYLPLHIEQSLSFEPNLQSDAMQDPPPMLPPDEPSEPINPEEAR